MKKLILFLAVCSLFAQEVNAQCAMCKAVAEDKANDTGASSINSAIIYIMAIPYIILFIVAMVAFRKKIIPFLKDMKNAKG